MTSILRPVAWCTGGKSDRTHRSSVQNYLPRDGSNKVFTGFPETADRLRWPSSFDLARLVHRRLDAGRNECRHCYASKRLTISDSLVFTGPAPKDMGAANHLRLRLVDVGSFE